MRCVRLMVACIGASALAALSGCEFFQTGWSLEEACTEPIYISDGGTLAGTTCDARDNVAVPCNPAGTPELVFALEDETGEMMWSLEPDPHSTVALMPKDDCGGPATCDLSTLSMKTGVRGIVYFVLETKGGGCGSWELNVARLP